MAPPEDSAQRTSPAGGRRTGWPMPIDDSTSILSPFLSNLPSMSSGISSLKGLLPLAPSPRAEAATEDTFAAWQDADLGDGRQRLLLLCTPMHALQVFAFHSGAIPDDQSEEAFPAPDEVASVPSIAYDPDVETTGLPGVKPSTPKEERALAAHILDRALWADRGPVVALIVQSPVPSRAAQGQLALVLVSLKAGKAFRRLDLGSGVAAAVSSSRRVIVVATSHPTPTIHVLDAHLANVHPPIAHLPVNPQTQLPIASVSGRLLAYATREAPAVPGREGLGSIVAATSAPLRAVSAASPSPQSPPPTTQGALLSSAVEIGGGVARGVWSGLKMGARMANDRLAQSAPSERGDVLPPGDSLSPVEGPESRSVEDGMVNPLSPHPAGGVWVKIVDFFPSSSEAEIIAHFRLPPSRALVAPIPSQGGRNAAHREYPVALLSFSPDGSRLFAAAADGRNFHILDVRPRAATRRGGCRGEVWDTYVLRRGNTSADVRSVAWSQDERWIAVGTGKGTVHVFPISPAGGKPTALSHASVKITNPLQLEQLSIEVTPFARLRPPRPASSDDLPSKADEAKASSFATAAFVASRRHPVTGGLCQDVVIYRPGIGQMELARLTAHARPNPPPAADARRGSNLTNMMREKAGLVPDGDLAVEQGLKARWALPLGQGASEAPVLPKGKIPVAKAPAAPATRKFKSRSLYHAEIRTHTSNPRILPTSIYLSRQIDFFAAVPTDEFSPLSVLDKVARAGRLSFRPEVEVHPPNADARSFDEPLNTALHSVMESRRLTPQLPQLPNGSPAKGSPFWSSIPIRNVAANLGEGMDRVRREYARAQRRRASAQQGSSFEDHPRRSDESEDATSSPSSLIPHTDGEDEWGELWEDEYRRAVEDDGPDDLVLGLLDEEEEERRKWERRQKDLESEYQK